MLEIGYNYYGDTMEGTKSNKNKKATANTSKKTKRVVNEVSSDELLEQILSKKKANKKSSTKKSTTVSSGTKSATTVKRTSKKTKQFNSLENDFIYDQILSNKASKAKTNKKKEIKTIDTKETVEDVVVDRAKTIEELEALLPVEFEEEKYDTYNSLEESVKRKKEHKDELELFLTEIENEKLLKQIRQALEDDKVEYIQPDYKVHSKDAIATIDSEINERIKKRALGDSDKSQNFIPITLICLILLSLGIFLCIIVNNIVGKKDLESKEKDVIVDLNSSKSSEESRLANEYNKCMNRELDEKDSDAETLSVIDNLNIYLSSNYNLSVLYTDLTSGYSYVYNPDVTYYAASTMKTLGALYVYEKAYKGELDLDTEVTYTKEHKMGSSAEMKNYKVGSKIKLRDLVKYSITVSDNTAHNMIIDYVGIDNVRNYGLNMGATLSHTNYDLFGYINIIDAKLYLNKLYYLVNNTGDFGAELEEYFLTADQNYLDIKDSNISAIHKYGEYENVYHDIGIVYDEHPYSIVILTNEGNKNHELVIRDVNSKIYELHNMFYSNRETYCTNLVYGK